VGFGTRMSNGCTSGHAICGIPRRQIRSLVASVAFIASAMAIATYRHYSTFLEKGNIFSTAIENKL